METNYTVHVFEVFEVRPVAPNEPTPVIRDVVVSVTTDSPGKIEDLARAAAIEAWPSAHSGDVPESFGVKVIDQTPPLS
jgi:hypothetical protein